jgi:uncharacterized membrane protein
VCRRLALIIAVLAFAALTTASPSNAEFRVCNKAKEKIDVAFGYDGGRQGFIAEGWWVLESGKCATVKAGALNLQYYYLYGRRKDGGEWDGSDDKKAGAFCVKNEKFTLYQRKYGDNEDEDCKKAGLESKSFFRVDVGEYRRWTQTLEDETVAAPAPPRPNPPPRSGGGDGGGGGAGGGNACQRFPNLC